MSTPRSNKKLISGNTGLSFHVRNTQESDEASYVSSKRPQAGRKTIYIHVTLVRSDMWGTSSLDCRSPEEPITSRLTLPGQHISNRFRERPIPSPPTKCSPGDKQVIRHLRTVCSQSRHNQYTMPISHHRDRRSSHLAILRARQAYERTTTQWRVLLAAGAHKGRSACLLS